MTASISHPVTVGELRKDLSDLISKVSFGQERTTISRNGKPVAALISVEDLELLNYLEDLEDLKALQDARAEDDGTRYSFEDVFGD